MISYLNVSNGSQPNVNDSFKDKFQNKHGWVFVVLQQETWCYYLVRYVGPCVIAFSLVGHLHLSSIWQKLVVKNEDQKDTCGQ